MQESSVVVFGSQAILASFDESLLPDEATRSREMDAAPTSAVELGIEDTEKRVRIDAYLGEQSEFHLANGFYVEGISPRTVTLPVGWTGRLVRFPDGATYGEIGHCLDPVDLCVSKMIAGRPKDLEFVTSLVAVPLVDVGEVLARLQSDIDWPDTYTDDRAVAVARAVEYLRHVRNRLT
ncbi:DUF6036 family nucleotidyltransferase [Gordonia sp. CPCC 205515]|uniref:DUF6036 family nucleotidyltransferase n=1 Tax=Gordonia sp. CPCC 205515 TaxID=3140791 RepID=UPI003AF39365